MRRWAIGQKVRIKTAKGLRAAVITHINFYNYTVCAMHMKTKKYKWVNVEDVRPY